MKIIGYENYDINEAGVIINTRTGRVLKQGKNQKGYSQVQLSSNGRSKTITVHRIVFKSFIGEIAKGLEINHIDGVKSNNSVLNLEAVSKKENMEKAVINGQIKSGSDCKLSVSVIQIDAFTKKAIETFGSINLASKKTNVAGSAISSVINKKRISAGGFLWERKNLK